MAISVILATYNGERYLMEQLESIRAQSLTPDEVIITDDGSTDGTLALAQNFQNQVRGKIRVAIVHHQSTRDPSDNFRFGVEHSTGDWIAFCDQDDRWLPQKLAVSLERAQARNAGFVSCEFQLIDASGNRLPGNSEMDAEIMIKRMMIPNKDYTLGCCQFLRRDVALLLSKHPPNDGNGRRESHDFASLMIARHLGGVVLIPDVLIEYRRHGANVSELKLTEEHSHAMWNQTGAENFLNAARTARARAAWWNALPESPTAKMASKDWARRAAALERRAHGYQGSRVKRTFSLLTNFFTGVYGLEATGRLPVRSFCADLFRLAR